MSYLTKKQRQQLRNGEAVVPFTWSEFWGYAIFGVIVWAVTVGLIWLVRL